MTGTASLETSLPILPGFGLGAISLGASLQGVLSALRAQSNPPYIDVTFDQTNPLQRPVIVELPKDGIRLRFDGPDQRLRLIEIVDFSKTRFTYKGSELVKEHSFQATGPMFKRIYQIFGASFPGHYVEPAVGQYTGTYILSYNGVALTFPLQHAAWSADKDHVSLLSSQAVGPASSMAIFEGRSWEEAKPTLFTCQPSNPRSLHMAARPKESLPPEIEYADIDGSASISLIRREPTSSFPITLNQTTPQDLLTELGPPDATHKRDLREHIPEPAHKRSGSVSKGATNGRYNTSQPSSYSSSATDTYDSNFDNEDIDTDPLDRASRETFWCYFSHGLDILVGPASQNIDAEDNANSTFNTSPQLVVTKVVLHGNVPGTYAFNRHRRLRWETSLDGDSCFTSQMNFDRAVKPAMLKFFADHANIHEMARGKVINRTWAGNAGDSSFFLPDAYDDLIDDGGSDEFLGNTQLYDFPHLAFEVTERGAISALTVS